MREKNTLIVRAYPRVHVALMDLGSATGRHYGGAGFTLSGPTIEVGAQQLGDQITIQGLERLDRQAQEDILRVLDGLVTILPVRGIRLSIQKMVPQHVGLGSKTALLLAVLEAAARCAGVVLSRDTLQRLSTRGGVSGIGIHSFFEGGFIGDAGQKSYPNPKYLPSSHVNSPEIPLMIGRWPIPANWKFHLILPVTRTFSREEEVRFFGEATPIPRVEVWESLAWLYHGVLPAVVTADLTALATSLRSIHAIGFKRRELEAQLPITKLVYRELSTRGNLAVGLSSMGPLIYIIGEDPAIEDLVNQICAEHGCLSLETHPGWNHGHEVLQHE